MPSHCLRVCSDWFVGVHSRRWGWRRSGDLAAVGRSGCGRSRCYEPRQSWLLVEVHLLQLSCRMGAGKWLSCVSRYTIPKMHAGNRSLRVTLPAYHSEDKVDVALAIKIQLEEILKTPANIFVGTFPEEIGTVHCQ